MKFVAVIPARGGSKRIPQKNVRMFGGKPIIAYSIEAAKESKLFGRIIVSTDSDEIAGVALAWGAEVPFRRPDALADDHASTVDVLLHAVEWLKANSGCDYVCCIYPTAPFLDGETLRQGFHVMIERGAHSAFSVVRFSYPIFRALQIDDGGRLRFIWPEHRQHRSQDFPDTYQDAGQFYWIEADYLLDQKMLVATQAAPVVLSPKYVHDIDTNEDWEIAELKYIALRKSRQPLATLVLDLPTSASRMVLGTAQLGYPYGIANRTGRPDAAATNMILCTAWAGGIRVYDTAQAYGDSEFVLGDFFAASYGFADVRFISKLHPNVDVRNFDEIRHHVEESLRRLKTFQIWALLVHREDHLNELDGTLGEVLRSLRRKGFIRNIGASVYACEYANRALLQSDIQIVEVAANVFDRRIKRLGLDQLARQRNKTLILRSVFLQGLAFMKPEDVPQSVPCGRAAVATLNEFCCEHRVDIHAFAYQYVRALFPDSLIVVGAESPEQVAQNCRVADSSIDRSLFEAWDKAWPDDIEELCNPSLWGRPLGPANATRSK